MIALSGEFVMSQFFNLPAFSTLGSSTLKLG